MVKKDVAVQANGEAENILYQKNDYFNVIDAWITPFFSLLLVKNAVAVRAKDEAKEISLENKEFGLSYLCDHEVTRTVLLCNNIYFLPRPWHGRQHHFSPKTETKKM